MSYGPIKVFAGTVASGASTVTFTMDKAYSRVFFEASTMSTAAAWDLYGSSDGTTYCPTFERVNTATIQYATLTVASGVGANGCVAPLQIAYPYVQLRASAVVSGGVVCKLVCWD